MNDCINICEYISLYVDGEMKIDTLKYNEILEHIKNCDECNDFFLEAENTLSGLKALKIEPPANLHKHIMSAINDEINGHIVQIKQAHKPKYLIIAGMIACLFAVIIYGNFFDNNPLDVAKRSVVPLSVADPIINERLLNGEYALTIVANGNTDPLSIDASLVYEDETSKYFEAQNQTSNIDELMDALTLANLSPTIIEHENPLAPTILIMINS